MDLAKYAKMQDKAIQNIRKQFAFKLYSSIVAKTPVDTGRARGNWQISIGSDTHKVLKRDDKSPVGSAPAYGKQEVDKIETAKGDESIFIVNNLPYICTLEYGGYPDPVKKGSWVKGKGNKKGRWVKKSAHGFSKQAPKGMVGLTVANAKNYIKQAIEEVEK